VDEELLCLALPNGSGTHRASTTHTCPKLENGLRVLDSSGSWCMLAGAMLLPPLRASVSSPSTTSGWSAGIQASASVNTTRPRASRLQDARLRNRWKTEMCRRPRAPQASATVVMVRRP
jgi:hypothetical protein